MPCSLLAFTFYPCSALSHPFPRRGWEEGDLCFALQSKAKGAGQEAKVVSPRFFCLAKQGKAKGAGKRAEQEDEDSEEDIVQS